MEMIAFDAQGKFIESTNLLSKLNGSGFKVGTTNKDKYAGKSITDKEVGMSQEEIQNFEKANKKDTK